MSQPGTSFTLPTSGPLGPGAMAGRIQEDLNALLSLNKGSIQPAYRTAGTLWLYDGATPWVMRFYDGTNWLDMATVDAGGHVLSLVGSKLRLSSTTDASLTSTDHGFQVGADTGSNLAIDNNEIVSRNNGAADTLYLNADGGNIGFGNSSSIVYTSGTLIAGATTPWDFTSSSDGFYCRQDGLMRMSSDGRAPLGIRRRSDNGDVLQFFRSTTGVGSVSVTTTATAYNTTSDYRLKYDVTPLVTFSLSAEQFGALPDALLLVMALHPVSYHRIEERDGERHGDWHHGFIAHELQEVMPHAVTGRKDAVRDVGTIVIPAHEETRRADDGAKSLVPVPEQRIENADQGDAPAGASWEKTGTVLVAQMVDQSKIVPDLVAAVQALTVMVLDLRQDLTVLRVESSGRTK